MDCATPALADTPRPPFPVAAFSEFCYADYALTRDSRVLTSTFTLRGDANTITFTEQVTLPAPIRDERAALPVMRLLALATGLSYYKVACPATITVPWGLTSTERTFLTRLIEGGLGEFAYRNQRVDALTPTIEAPLISTTPAPPLVAPTAPPLVTVGGGKDSVVSIETCKAAGLSPVLFSVNRYQAIDRCVGVAGCDYATATRTIDPTLFDLNRAGGLNGHIPVTAINSLIAILASHALGTGPVVMSNEASASDGNLEWEGHQINHQWSKSLAFENLLRDALSHANEGPPPYFSLLRPLNELQIAERFSHYPQYFPAFTSCNRAFTLDEATRRSHWCCVCPKCLFVYLILAPWLSRTTMVSIFGVDILDETTNMPGFAEILGVVGHKPFECVGQSSEARDALRRIGDQASWSESACVAPLLKAIDSIHDEDQPPTNLSATIPDNYIAALGVCADRSCGGTA